MKRLFVIPIILIFGCQPPSPPPCVCGISGEDIVAIRNLEQDFLKVMFKKDVEKAAAILSEDIVAMPPGSPEVVGIEAYKEMIGQMPEMMEFEFLEVEIEGGNNVAYAKGNYVMTFENEGREVAEEGSFVEIWKKNEQGLWKMYRDIWNAGKPMVTTDTTFVNN